MTQVPRVQIETAEELYTEYFAQNKPVIITNFQDTWADPTEFTKAGLTERVRMSVCVCVCVRMCVYVCVCVCVCDSNSFTCITGDVCALYELLTHTIHKPIVLINSISNLFKIHLYSIHIIIT